jgi:hypothetical protein
MFLKDNTGTPVRVDGKYSGNQNPAYLSNISYKVFQPS